MRGNVQIICRIVALDGVKYISIPLEGKRLNYCRVHKVI